MSSIVRLCLATAVAGILAGCASAPPNAERPVAVRAQAEEISKEYSSFNAQVLSEAAEVENSFTTNIESETAPVTRLESAYTQKMGDENLRVGDTVSSIGMWGTAVRFGGVQFGSRTSNREDVIAASRLASTGVSVLPTVADALFASVGDPGMSFNQQNLSASRGNWDPTNLTVADEYGRSESVDGPMIAGTQLAEGGCGDFSVGVGRVRRDYAITSNDYGPAFANTTVTCAAPLGFTVEGHGEYLADEVAALGFGVARRIGPIGTASVALAQSQAEIGAGWLARVGFDHRNSLFNIMLRSRLQSREFREVGSIGLEDPIMERNMASVGVNVTEGSNLSLAYATQMTWARERSNVVALKQSVSVGRGSLSMSAGHSLEDNFGSSLFISFQRPLGTVRRQRDLIEEFDLDALGLPGGQ
jgi:outer membrane usher protein FimD/PapC